MNAISDEWKESLTSLCRTVHIDIDRRQSDLMALYASHLLSWNEKTNLTSITDPLEVAETHILDSLIPGKYIQSIFSRSEVTLMDFGSGNGLPSIPLKIFMPQLHITMVDSIRKKINFLKYVIRAIQLDGIIAAHARIEKLVDLKDFAGRFDIVISRAFSSLDKFLILAAPFTKTLGYMIAMKGNNLDKELNLMAHSQIAEGIYQMGRYQLTLNIKRYVLPKSGCHRALVIVKKANAGNQS